MCSNKWTIRFTIQRRSCMRERELTSPSCGPWRSWAGMSFLSNRAKLSSHFPRLIRRRSSPAIVPPTEYVRRDSTSNGISTRSSYQSRTCTFDCIVRIWNSSIILGQQWLDEECTFAPSSAVYKGRLSLTACLWKGARDWTMSDGVCVCDKEFRSTSYRALT